MQAGLAPVDWSAAQIAVLRGPVNRQQRALPRSAHVPPRVALASATV
jgi:hypothetical protein